MKRNIAVLSLGILLFLVMATNALASNNVNGQVGSSQIKVSISELNPGYYLCAVWDDDELLALFDYLVGNDGKMKTTVEVGRTLSSNDNLTLGISGANANSDPITLNIKITSSAGNNGGGNFDNPSTSHNYGDSGNDTSYNVNLPSNITGGQVSVQPSQAPAGSTVNITAVSNQGYKLDMIKIIDAEGKLVQIKNVRGQRYMFTMPASQADVQVVFQPQTEYSGTFYSLPFTDVKIGDWYYEAIRYVFTQAFMSGESQTLFNPNGNLNRAMLAVILYRMEEEPQLYLSSSFNDVSANKWYSNAAVWGKASGIINGYEDGSFAPLQNVTREEIATILYRFAQFKGQDISLKGNLSIFSDSNTVSDWAIEAMQWAVGSGIIAGDNGALKPSGNATRAEVAVMIMRFIEN